MSAKQNIRFIINPISGIGRQKTVELLVSQHLDSTRFGWEFVYTEGPKHATELARAAVADGCAIVVAVGGDGSVNEVGTGLIGSNSSMAIIPAGSGNGLARHLGIPLRVPAAVAHINTAKPTKIDTVTLNGNVFLGVAGVGFDAHIAHEFDTFGQRGLQGYIRITMRELLNYQTGHYRLIVDGETHEYEAFVISIANSSQFGNNAIIAPEASMVDGWLDVVVIRKFPYAVLPGLVTRMFQGNINGSQYAEAHRGKHIRIEQPGTIAHIDGEPVEVGHLIDIAVQPLSLNVLV